MCSVYLSWNYFSSCLVLLALLIRSFIILESLRVNKKRFFIFRLTVLLLIITYFFLVDSLLSLYMLFELSVIPTIYLIIKWGYQPERLQAVFYFTIYTICASLPILIIILIIKSFYHTYNFNFIFFFPLTYNSFHIFTLILAFLVKVPIWGVHLWLPKAHVEAPIAGSIILAGLLLKLGGYGLLLMKKIFLFWRPMIIRLNIWGSIYISFLCLVIIDIKTLIAYSSIIHMGIIIVGIFRESIIGLWGALIIMISHGFVSPGIFSLANFNYEKRKTRNIAFFEGMAWSVPSLNLFWFIYCISNAAAPPTVNFFREIFIARSLAKIGLLLISIFMLVILRLAYNLYIFSIIQGKPTQSYITFSRFLLRKRLIILPIITIIPIIIF